MKQRRFFSTELAYVFGILALAFGTALMEKADFGVSMVVAPAYLLHLKLSTVFPAFTFGMAEYSLQALLLIVMSLILRRFRLSSLFSFVTAVIYGLTLDLCILLVGLVPLSGLWYRHICYVIGILICSFGVSLLFHTYLPPEAYELFVKEVSSKLGTNINRTKTVYDLCSCLIGVILSFLFFGFGRFEGVKLGTVLCALVNGWLIGRCSALLERSFDFKDALPWRPFFQK